MECVTDVNLSRTMDLHIFLAHAVLNTLPDKTRSLSKSAFNISEESRYFSLL